jgi:O-antigen ligase
LGLNSGPWKIWTTPNSLIGWGHYIRTVAPFFVLVFTVLPILNNRREKFIHKLAPLNLWLIYGLIGLISCALSPRPSRALYWALAYLSVFAASYYYLRGDIALPKVILLNYASWIITCLMLCTMLVFARDVLFVDVQGNITGYGIVSRMGTVADMSFSRSSGMARFAAVPGIISFVSLVSWRGRARILWLFPFIASCLFVWFMQSRGAILGLTAAISFSLLFLNKYSRLIGVLIILALSFSYATDLISDSSIGYFKKHFTRGATHEQLLSLTGRTLSWKLAWREIKRSPVIGWGPQSDRYLTRQHVHNTYLYALLQGGFLGGILFAGGLVWAWALFFQSLLRRVPDHFDNKTFFIQAGSILAFFTVRSIPEVCGAMFGVDFVIMLPIIAYLSILAQEGKTIYESQNNDRRQTPAPTFRI